MECCEEEYEPVCCGPSAAANVEDPCPAPENVCDCYKDDLTVGVNTKIYYVRQS